MCIDNKFNDYCEVEDRRAYRRGYLDGIKGCGKDGDYSCDIIRDTIERRDYMDKKLKEMRKASNSNGFNGNIFVGTIGANQYYVGYLKGLNQFISNF